MNIKQLHTVFFIGIGGIGMSALARYFKHQGFNVLGYDKTPNPVTKALRDEDIEIHFSDDVSWAKEQLTGVSLSEIVVVYTPAVPFNLGIKTYFESENVRIIKRAEALGIVTQQTTNLSIAGTHGKTTTSCLLAHILSVSEIPQVAFLGGISSNLNSNYYNTLKENTTSVSVTEADEFDRSFLHLTPKYAAITNMDADHLDIYGDKDSLTKSFIEFGDNVNPDGKLFVQADCQNEFKRPIITYGIEQGHISARNVHIHEGQFIFDLYLDSDVFRLLKLGIPGKHNIENAVAASCIALEMGVSEDQLRNALETFKGVKRRFEYVVNTKEHVFIDDYAHHPTELKAIISATKELYPSKKITGIFQPHLFTRTRDFMDEFAESLSLLDEIILLDIYPARELPIEGVDSQVLLEKIRTKKSLETKERAINKIASELPEVLLTLGAGDIDSIIQPLKSLYV